MTRGGRFRRLAAWVAAVVCLAGSGQAYAQVFQVGRWSGALEGVLEYTSQNVNRNDIRVSRLENRRTEERLSLYNSGAYFYDPRLLVFNLGGTFGLSQEDFTIDAGSGSASGELWGYDLSAAFLPEGDFSVMATAARNESRVPVWFAGRSSIISENRGITLFAYRLFLPSILSVRQEFVREDSATGSVFSRRDDERNIVRYEGQRGWVDSEARLQYEFIDDTDKVYPTQDYRSHEGTLFYSREFGTELNWRWDSFVRYFDRTGASDFAQLKTSTVDESLRVEHTDDLRTEYHYYFSHTDIPAGSSRTHIGEANLIHELYESLVTRLGVDTRIETLPGGERDRYGGGLDFGYTKRLPVDAVFGAGVGGRLAYEEDAFREAQSFVPQETHLVASPFAQPVALDSPFVDQPSVVVTKVAFGPLPPGCFTPPGPPTPLLLGRDYTLRTVGDITEVVPLPCGGSTPGINPGDTIAVDYGFAAPASLEFLSAIWNANLGVDFGWVRPYYAHDQTDEHLLSGIDGQFLDDRRSDTLGIEFRYDRGPVRASALGEQRWYDSDRLTFDSLRSSQSVSAEILRELRLTMNAEEARIDYENPTRRNEILALRAILSYAFRATLVADATAGYRTLSDSLFPSEDVIETGLHVRWRVGQLEVRPSVDYLDWRRGDADTNEVRTLLYVTRRF